MSRIKPAPDSAAVIPADEAHDALMRSTARGSDDGAWRGDENSCSWLFSMDGLSHGLRLEMLPTDAPDAAALETLKRLRSMMTTNAAFVILHILNELLQAAPTPENPTMNVFLDLDHAARQCGLDPRSAAERLEVRADVWAVIQFMERARVVGERRGVYIDADGQKIDTSINVAPVRVMSTEDPDQRALFGSVPVRVEIGASAEWMRLLKSPQLRQTVPGMALLAGIPGSQPSGAWAKAIGLALAGFWRRNALRTVDGSLRPTRRELLTRFPPAKAPIEVVLGSPNPRRVIEYWCGALDILTASGFVEKSGEALLSIEGHRARLQRQGWQDGWLDESVALQPGVALRDSVHALADRKPRKKR